MKKIIVITFIIVSAVVFVFFTDNNRVFSKSLSFETDNKQVGSIDGMDTALKLQSVYRNIAKTIMPAVVSINVESVQVVQNPYSQFFNDPFFRQFFGEEGQNMPKEYKRKLQAMGSGFIVTKDGYLFTNFHVVNNATKIVVILSDKRQFDAKVIGTDPETDIALIKINANNLPVVAIGDSGDVQVGDLAVAIGNPFGLSGTYTSGIISAVGRPGMTSGFQRFIQTDTPINPGNSGGPLVNIKGQVIAINAAIQSQTGGYQGIGFAIPINIAKNIANQIVDHGKIVRGYLGITPTALDATTRKLLGISDNEGVMISKVEKGSPAEKAGLKKGDIITKVNNESVNAPEDLQVDIGSLKPGSMTKIEFYRDKKKTEVDLKLEERPSEIARANQPSEESNSTTNGETFNFMGAVFVAPSDSILQQNGADFGVMVSEVKDDSIFAGTLEEGSIVSGINQVDIKTLNDLKTFASKNKNTKSFTFLIVKDGFMYYRGVEK